jgi:2-methylisocitrate lyase-like PEP mutase family enzyme
MSAFADLHRPGDPLVLPNAWDHASAAALAAAGFPAVGTTSLGVAAALGLPDGAAATAEATIDLAHRLTHLPVPVSMDIENGFSTDPAEVAAYVDRLGAVAGVNLEDQLGDPASFAQVLVAVTGRGVFINARVDTYWLGGGGVDATLERAKAYVAAGADGIFVPGVKDETEIARLAEALPVPLNVLFLPNTLSLPRLAELGVARISTGSLLYRVALGAAVSAAAAVRDGGREFEAPSYAAVDGLARK